MAKPNKNIDELLEKYWNAETDLTEESILKNFFTEAEEENLTGDYFKFLVEEKKKKPSRDYLAKINQLERQHLEQDVNSSRRVRMLPRRWINIAASFLVLVAAVLWFNNYNNSNSFKEDTFDDPRLAWEATKEALSMLNSKMNSGTKNMEKVTELNKLSIIKKT